MDCFASPAMTFQNFLFSGSLKIESRTCAGGGALPLPLWERVGERGRGLSIVRNPSPGSHLTMRSDLSHKGRGEIERDASSPPYGATNPTRRFNARPASATVGPV